MPTSAVPSRSAAVADKILGTLGRFRNIEALSGSVMLIDEVHGS